MNGTSLKSFQSHLVLSPSADNPRNSEGDFIQGDNGRVMFIYTRFTGGSGDHASADLAAKVSEDSGQTWSKDDKLVIENEAGMNVMSVSLLRLQPDKIALFYLRKDSLEDCRPYMRISEDDGKTWSEAKEIIPEEQIGYYVLNNDRVVQLKSGRLIVPLAMHLGPGIQSWTPQAHIVCYYSDDDGETWQQSESTLTSTSLDPPNLQLQEPGVVEVGKNSLLMFIRTNGGSQYFSRSTDGGVTWSTPHASSLKSPLSPASIERIPSTGMIAAVWNDHENITAELKGKRTPLTLALSSDGGKTWTNKRILENDPNGWYCYTAIEFIDNRMFLAYCAGDRRTGGLNTTKIVSIDLNELLQK